MFAVARFLLKISQRTYPVASRMKKAFPGAPRRSKAAGSGERMAWKDDSVTSAVHPIADISLRRSK
jgi:hypothetical protein